MQVPRGNTFQKKVTEAPDSKNGRQLVSRTVECHVLAGGGTSFRTALACQ